MYTFMVYYIITKNPTSVNFKGYRQIKNSKNFGSKTKTDGRNMQLRPSDGLIEL